MWNGPSLWERRARNKKSMILKRKTMIQKDLSDHKSHGSGIEA
jgi:hypothetical protein